MAENNRFQLPKRLTRVNSNVVEGYEYNNTNTNTRNMIIVNLNNPFSLYPHVYFSTNKKLKGKNKELKTDKLLFFKSSGTSNPRFGGLYKGLWLPTLGTAIKYHHNFKKKHNYIVKLSNPNLVYMIDVSYINSYRQYKGIQAYFKKTKGKPYLQNEISLPGNDTRKVSIDDIMIELLTYCQTWDMLKLCVKINTDEQYKEFQTSDNLFTHPGMQEFINDVITLKQCELKICDPKDNPVYNKEYDSLEIVGIQEMNEDSEQIHLISQKNINMFRDIIGKNAFNSSEDSTGILPIKCNKTECVIDSDISSLEAAILEPLEPLPSAEALPSAAEASPKTKSTRKTRAKSPSGQTKRKKPNNIPTSNRRVTRSMSKQNKK
jgi:hypothetical protein